MGFWKGLVDKVAKKKDELEEEAKKRAAQKATDMAIDTGKAAARAAVRNAGKTLDYAGKRLEEALFGGATEAEHDAASSDDGDKAPDPFAKLKAEEAAQKAAARQRDKSDQDEQAAARARAEARARTEREVEREVDDELAALKKKIRGK